MATEFQRSEIMPDAPPSSEPAFGPPAQADVSADAALILTALGRMEAVIRDERAAFDRLRKMLGDMAQAIAKAKAVADSETAANALDELEHRVDAMIEIASGAGSVAESQASQAPAVSAPPVAPVATAVAENATQVPPADDAPAPGPPGSNSAEHDQVPTVSGVVSQLAPTMTQRHRRRPISHRRRIRQRADSGDADRDGGSAAGFRSPTRRRQPQRSLKSPRPPM